MQALARRNSDSGFHPSVVIAKRFPADLEKGPSQKDLFHFGSLTRFPVALSYAMTRLSRERERFNNHSLQLRNRDRLQQRNICSRGVGGVVEFGGVVS